MVNFTDMEQLKTETIWLVTGASGHLGTNVIRALKSIEIEGGTQRGRTVRVRALDWLDYAAKYPINSPAISRWVML